MTSRLFKGGRLINDRWRLLEDGEPIPGNVEPIVFRAARWLANHENCLRYQGDKGILLRNSDAVAEIKNDLSILELICIDFPLAVDGRGYSQARLLRERYNYRGELRAVGDVLVDQLVHMHRCGFDAFALQGDQKITCLTKYLRPFSVTYQ